MRLLVLSLSLLLTGCSGLLVRQDDPAALAVTKTVWRTALGVATLGLSEIRMAELREEANAEVPPDQRLHDYESHLTYLVNNGVLSQADAEDLYQRYAGVIFQEALEATAAGGASDFWAGYPTGAVGTQPISAGRVFQLSPPLRSWTSSSRTLLFSRSGLPSTRWSRLTPFSRSYLHSIPTGKGYARRGGRRR